MNSINRIGCRREHEDGLKLARPEAAAVADNTAGWLFCSPQRPTGARINTKVHNYFKDRLLNTNTCGQ